MNARVAEPRPGEAVPVEVAARPAAEPVLQPAPAIPGPKKKRNGRRIAIMASVPVLIAAVGGYFWLSGGRYVDTDNAYVQQAKVAISADIAGRVAQVAVHDNEPVTAGQLLFSIDPEPYRIALAQAEASLASARVSVEQLRVAHNTAEAQLEDAQATLAVRREAFDRKQALQTDGLASDAAMDDVKLALQTAETQVSLAEQQLSGAVAALGGNPEIATDDHPTVRAALAARDSAARNLENTRVMAPADGIVSQVGNLNVGQFIAVGTTIASLVETKDTWIEANFKETQLAGISAGMPVEVKVDAYPGIIFEGHVESIGAATGAQFALIPAQNATGNWVKVTQRVPVRIEMEDTGAEVLRAGMSAVVAVDTKPEQG